MAYKKNQYDSRAILKEAVGSVPHAYVNDLDNDNQVTAADARLAARMADGLEPDLAAGQAGTAPTDNMGMAMSYLDQYRNGKYNYDLYADPVYQQARAAAMQQGQLAAKNTAALAAQYTGGYGNSYGTTAAQQQYNAALQNVNEIVPQLEANAYGRFQDQQNQNLRLSQMYLDMANDEYNRELNEAQLAAQYGDYGGLNARGINTAEYEAQQKADREWNDLLKKRQQQEWSEADDDRAWEIAVREYKMGYPGKLTALLGGAPMPITGGGSSGGSGGRSSNGSGGGNDEDDTIIVEPKTAKQYAVALAYQNGGQIHYDEETGTWGYILDGKFYPVYDGNSKQGAEGTVHKQGLWKAVKR